MPTYVVALFGKYLCYALLALALDLVWGYCGILSLGHGAFFALGGYAMGMYLMRQIGSRGVYANPILPDFMVFLNWKELPWYWYGFDNSGLAALMVVLVPGAARLRLRLVRLPQPRHRRLSLDHHPGDDLRAAARLLPQRHGLRRQQRPDRLQGHPRLQRAGDGDARRAVRRLGAWRWRSACSISSAIVRSKFGKVLVAVRDAESRTRFLGYRVEHVKLFAFVVSACMAGIAGALYVPQVGIINPGEFAPANSIEVVIWTAVGGRGTLVGPIIGAILVNVGKSYFTGALPDAGCSCSAGCSSSSRCSCPRASSARSRGRRWTRARRRSSTPPAATRHEGRGDPRRLAPAE